MKKIMKILILGLVVVTLHLTPYTFLPAKYFGAGHFCYAAFEDLGCGARPIGMGNAFCGVADDINAFLYNPAGLSQLKKLQLSTMYAQLYPGLSDKSNIANNFIAIAYPFGSETDRTSLGFSWFNLGVVSDPDRSNATYKENTYIVSYARGFEMFSFGLSVKLHTKEYGENDWTRKNSAVFGKTRTAAGMGFDAGIMFKPDEKLAIGLSVTDFNQPYLYIITPSQIPFTTRAGLGYKFDSVGTFENIIGALDITYRDGEYKGYAGLEGWLLDRSVGLRAGFGTGSSSFVNIAFGASYQLTEEVYNNDFRIDYAFGYPLNGLQPTAGTHRVSLTIGFGPK